MKWPWVFFLTLAACSLSSERDFRAQAKEIVQDITSVLKKVETHEELQASVSKLKGKFNKLAELLAELRSFRERRPEVPFSDEPLPCSDDLFAELARLYEIPGCREIVESAQIEAVYKLHKK